jgi:tetratricopeptide (TPR) repeat protein
MHANLGGVYFYRDQLDDARKEFQTALRIYPDFPEAMEYYGLVEARLGQDQEALRLLVTALYKTGKDNINYDFWAVNLASHFMKLGNNDDALKILDGDIAMSPGYARAWSTRAAIRYARGEVAAARDDAQTALRLDPANTQAQNLLRFMKAPAPRAPVP